MPKMQAMPWRLNAAFGGDELARLAGRREAFAPGNKFNADVFTDKDSSLNRLFADYLDRMPGVFQETLRSAVYYALSTTPPTQITFAWAPGYDYEVTFWQTPDIEGFKGGITILLKSRYPDDPHPLAHDSSPRASA